MDTKLFPSKRKNIIWAGIFLAQFLLYRLAQSGDHAVQLFSYLFEVQKRAHQLLFSVAPFSVGDVFYLSLFLYLFWAGLMLFKVSKKKRILTQLLIVLNVLFFCYQFFWGMLYFQKPLQQKFASVDISSTEVKALALSYLEKCKLSRRGVKEDGSGVFALKDVRVIQAEILNRQKGIPEAFLGQRTKTDVLSVKESLFGYVMSYTGISGYYNPFTAEAQYDSNLPPSSIPFTLAHEMAHQLGFAREQEASFIGYLTGKNSDNAELRYSTEYYVLKSLLSHLSDSDPAFVQKVLANFSPAMKRDRLAEIRFGENHASFLTDILMFTNDLFLKSNRQEGSITYSYFVDLLVKYELQEEAK